MTDVFSEKLVQWRAYTATPWGRIRYTVVAEILRRQCAELGEGLRILDVTILDPSESWLAEAKRRAAEAGTSLNTIVTGGPEAALTELRADTKRTETFDHDVRKVPMADLEAELAAAGLRLTGRQEPFVRIAGMYQLVTERPA